MKSVAPTTAETHLLNTNRKIDLVLASESGTRKSMQIFENLTELDRKSKYRESN
jgi:hypothetical protein